MYDFSSHRPPIGHSLPESQPAKPTTASQPANKLVGQFEGMELWNGRGLPEWKLAPIIEVFAFHWFPEVSRAYPLETMQPRTDLNSKVKLASPPLFESDGVNPPLT